MRSRPAALLGVLLGLAFLSGGLTSCGDPCDAYGEVATKADAEGEYFKYEDQMSSLQSQCQAQYGV